MDIQWLVDSGNMLLITTGSNFSEIEDNFSIDSFASKVSIVSFDNVPEVFNYE